MVEPGREQYLVRAWEERPIWVAAKSARDLAADPLCLVAHPEGCAYRRRMVAVLKEIGRDWRIAYASPDISGLQNAVSAALGVSALTRATLREDMRILTDKDGFPPLEKIRIGLFYKNPRVSRPGLILSDYLIACLDQATNRHFRPSAHPG